MIYCFDIDGTICNDTKGKYPQATPHLEVILKLNELYDAGNTIIVYTARGTTSGIDWHDLTEKQLKDWNIKYHKLIMGKPGADVYIDDKCIPTSEWLKRGEL